MPRALSSRALALGCVAVAAFACGRPERQVRMYPVLVHAADDLGRPLPGVQLMAAGHDLGVTDASGDKLLNLPGVEGQRIDFAGTCPDGFAGPREQPLLLLKQVQSLQSPGVQAIELNLVCDAKEHVEMVAIRTGHAGIPVLLRGQPVALTSSAGTAHVFLKEPVGNSFQLTLDTMQLPDLRPQSPTRMFAVNQRDEFTVWDQPFEETKHPRVRKWHRRKKVEPAEPPPPPPPPKHIPERIR